MSDEFVNSLAQTPPPLHVYNPYHHALPANAIRRHNLRLYLEQMAARQPRVMLVAEAPGYRGCRLSGIPFASPMILQDGVAEAGLFGVARGYQLPPEWPHIRREASATIVWQTLIQAATIPLLWNAFPFHPHRPNEPQSNRTPTATEIALGRPFLEQLLNLFPITTVVAVGNKADDALTRWQIPHQKVRHPSHGGKRPFQRQVLAILEKAAAA